MYHKLPLARIKVRVYTPEKIHWYNTKHNFCLKKRNVPIQYEEMINNRKNFNGNYKVNDNCGFFWEINCNIIIHFFPLNSCATFSNLSIRIQYILRNAWDGGPGIRIHTSLAKIISTGNDPLFVAYYINKPKEGGAWLNNHFFPH